MQLTVRSEHALTRMILLFGPSVAYLTVTREQRVRAGCKRRSIDPDSKRAG